MTWDRGISRGRVALSAALAAAALCSCAAKRPVGLEPPGSAVAVPPPPPAAQAEETVLLAQLEPDLEALYAQLEDNRLAYEQGLELAIAGEDVEAEGQLAEATNRIVAGAAACSRIAGCELQRFLDTFEGLLSLQGLASRKVTPLVETPETNLEESAEVEPGTEPGPSPLEAAVPEMGRTVALLRGTDLHDIIQIRGPVKAAMDDWLTWMRPMLIDAYENYQFLRDSIAPIYEEAGLPEALLFAMIATESGGKVHAFSRAGAAGPLQFMPQTGRRYGLHVVDGFDLRLDPVAATKANVAYLNERFTNLSNDLEKALAAYNGGEARMESLHRRLGGVSFWDSRIYHALPTETREYVPRILAAAWLFLHPEDYNLRFPDLQTDKSKLTLEQDISIDELTICLGEAESRNGWFRILRNLNPRLDAGERIKAGREIEIPSQLVPIYQERCLDGAQLARARELRDARYPDRSSISPGPRPASTYYRVRRGDTLASIAARHGCASVRELAALNRVRPPRYVIRPGQRLTMPNCRR